MRTDPLASFCLCIFLVLVGCSSAATPNGGSCTTGNKGCACYPNDTCNAGLVCSSALCVPEGGGNGGSSGSGGSVGGGGTAGSGGSGGVAGGGGNSSGGSAGSGSGGPIILNLSTNVTVLNPGGTLTVTAVVTHPQGIAQVVGGTLSDPPAGGTYGAFQVSTTAGAYSLSLTFEQIQSVRDITTPSGGQARSFRAQFYDQAGHVTVQDFNITLACPVAAHPVCGGSCDDTVDHCGTCQHACPVSPDGNTSECSAPPSCYFWVHSTSQVSCDSVCAGAGGTCNAVPLSATGRHAYSTYPTGTSSTHLILQSCAGLPQATYSSGGGLTYPFSFEDCPCGD